MKEKLTKARELIVRVLEEYSRPVVMSSFGKDSMVMLDIIKRMGHKFPVLFHREPFFPKKHEFANTVIAENKYVVYDYPPLTTAMTKKGAAVEIVNYYQVGGDSIYLPTGIVPPEEGKEFLCGRDDLYLKPTGTFKYPWDVGFVGHKSTDRDPILGAIPLRVDIRHNFNSADYAFPLRHFTDADIWEYHRQFGVPVNEKRYDPSNNFRERGEIEFNNDYYHACTLCLDRDAPQGVFCPKFKKTIPNISRQVRYVEPTLPDYVGDGIPGVAHGR